MKWKSKPTPKEGDRKEKIKFALLPTKVQDKWLWLEKYIAIYEYKKYYYERDIVVSEGLFIEKYYTDIAEALHWEIVERKFITANAL